MEKCKSNGRISFSLEDKLCHPRYHWPLTLLRYPVQFPPGEAHAASLRVREKRDGRFEDLLFQFVDVVLQDEYVVSATVCIYADLPSGGKREFIVDYSAAPAEAAQTASAGGLSVSRTNGGYEASGDYWRFVLFDKPSGNKPLGIRPASGLPQVLPIFEMQCRSESDKQEEQEQHAQGYLVISDGVTVKTQMHCLAQGPLFAEFEFHCQWLDGRCYRLHMLVHGQLPLIELREELSGFGGAGTGEELQIRWNLGPLEQRYSPNREEEPMDSYLNADGSLPVMLLPYRSWNSWWHEKTLAFRSKTVIAGVFVGDVGVWDDGQYSLWGWETAMGVRFRVGEAGGSEPSCICSYPLAGKRRQTAVTLFRSCAIEENPMREVEKMRVWYSLLHLNKVKEWILRWNEPQEEYPRLFAATPEFQASVEDMEKQVYQENHNMNTVEKINPVSAREFFTWVPLFDVSAPLMNPEQFNRLKAASAFMAYVHEDENVMPIRHMLAGHPNFLADVTAVHGMMAALLPHHPHAIRWKERFEQAAALNMKYHIRPAVSRYDTLGGRWTENIGCYTWAALKPMLQTASLLGDNPLLYPRIKELAYWLLHAVSAPFNGSRKYPPQGAHSRTEGIPSLLRVLAQMLMRYDPLLGEQILHITTKEVDFEPDYSDVIWRQVLRGKRSDKSGVMPPLATLRFTGYGIIHRAAVGMEDEMSVHLQQLDQGPNYRWGRASEGGNGVLYYYAKGKRYSYNGPEDVGDLNRGDVEACTNFAVIDDRQFRGIGPCELTEPTYDFTFAQYSRIVSDPGARPHYLSRSVTMSGCDYIVLYDEVADRQTKGRFSWFVHEQDDFPSIYQLVPAVPFKEAKLETPVDSSPDYSHSLAPVNGRYYDGCGDFLTLVSHRGTSELQVKGVSFGAVVRIGRRTDYLFRRAAMIRYREGDIGFEGKSGMIRHCADSGKTELAIFAGRSITYGSFSVHLRMMKDTEVFPVAGFAMTCEDTRMYGEWQTFESCLAVLNMGELRLAGQGYVMYVDGEATVPQEIAGNQLTFRLSSGRHVWEWSLGLPKPGGTEMVQNIAMRDSAQLQWKSVPSAQFYEIRVRCLEDESCQEWVTESTDRLLLTGISPGLSYIVQIRAGNRDQTGPWSQEYPLYGTDTPPGVPDGLRIVRLKQGYQLSWGRVNGAFAYLLYRKEQGEADLKLIYNGPTPSYIDESVSMELVYEYCTAAVNGIGTGSRSATRDTLRGGLADWDPRPGEFFRRDPRNHEYGFSGYDSRTQDALSLLLPYQE